jgi:hypothetical protein
LPPHKIKAIIINWNRSHKRKGFDPYDLKERKVVLGILR